MDRNTKSRAVDPNTIALLRKIEAGGQSGFLRQLIDLFLDLGPKHLAGMREALAMNDPKRMRLESHTLKSSCASLGAIKMSEVCQNIQDHADTGHLEGTEALLKEIETEYERVKFELLQEIND